MLASKRFVFQTIMMFYKVEFRNIAAKPTEITLLTHGNSKSLNQQQRKTCGINEACVWLCVAWSICRIPGKGSRYCCWCFNCLLGTYSSNGLSCPVWIQGIGHALLAYRGGLSLSEWLWRTDKLEETEGGKRKGVNGEQGGEVTVTV